MNQGEPQGCLTAILWLFGINLGDYEAARELPYRQRDDFLSAVELSFYRVLSAAVGDRAVICPKVNLADIFFVARPNNESQAYRNKIDRKHVDFLVCDSATMRPLCGIELDDFSHKRRDRRDRDDFVDQLFEVAGVPLVRVVAKATYSPAALLELIEPHLNGKTVSRSTVKSINGTPNCPKCGVAMVERVTKTGVSAGKSFWGCRNYPKCKEILRARSV